MIERFLTGLDAMLREPADTDYVAVVFPGDLDPFERHYRYGIHIDAELRLAGLGTSGGGSSVDALGEDGEWRTGYVILDTDLTDLDAGRELLRLHLPQLGCPPGTLIQFGDREDRWDGERWHIGEDRSFDEDTLEGK